MKKFLRTFLVLCLCCSIVFSAAIPQAKAFDLAGAVLYNIAGNIGVNAALRAIGVGPGNSPEAFNNLVNDIANSEIVNTAGQILVAGSTGDFKGFFQKTFLQGILDFMFDNGVVSEGDPSTEVIPAAYWDSYNERLNSWVSSYGIYPYVALRVTNLPAYPYYLYFSRYPFVLDSDTGFYVSFDNSGDSYTFVSYSGGTTGNFSSFPSYVSDMPSDNVSFFFSGDSAFTSEDLTIDALASSVDSSLYDSWTANGGTYDGGDYIPVSIPSLDASAISSQTQAQAQAGTIPDAVVEEIIAGSEAVPDTDTGTIAGVIDAIKALPQTLADLFTGIKDAVLSIPQAIADVFSPPAASEAFQISLMDFFPFCIPFDLYNLLDALAAPPEAPVIQGVIPVPTFGQVYDIEVDLSEWDNIASLFRTLQLGLFIVGLALVTRERFLRS